MKKVHVIIIGLLFVIAAAFSNRHFATTWAGTASNQMVTRQALNDAVTNGVFTEKQSFPSDSRVVTKAMAQQYVNINTISGYDMNRLVPKSVFVAATPFYTHTLKGQYWGDGWDGYSGSSSALSSGPGGSAFDVYTLYNRPLAVGDEVLAGASSSAYPGIPHNGGSVSGGPYYWFYYPALNAAVQVTNTISARQYIISIAYPPSLTNVSVCIEVTYTGLDAVSVRAYAATAVDTNVSVSWSYSINDGSYTAGSSVTITTGNNYSSPVTVTGSGAISSFNVSLDGFSPASSSTQNYISGGQCS
ncbi:MAG TPA: hypothetical protein VJ552_05290 [Sediminibacterium sp.]|nr:hypothetical protein [Sediminibacterium sp.]